MSRKKWSGRLSERGLSLGGGNARVAWGFGDTEAGGGLPGARGRFVDLCGSRRAWYRSGVKTSCPRRVIAGRGQCYCEGSGEEASSFGGSARAVLAPSRSRLLRRCAPRNDMWCGSLRASRFADSGYLVANYTIAFPSPHLLFHRHAYFSISTPAFPSSDLLFPSPRRRSSTLSIKRVSPSHAATSRRACRSKLCIGARSFSARSSR